jgi:hypothetical protein
VLVTGREHFAFLQHTGSEIWSHELRLAADDTVLVNLAPQSLLREIESKLTLHSGVPWDRLEPAYFRFECNTCGRSPTAPLFLRTAAVYGGDDAEPKKRDDTRAERLAKFMARADHANAACSVALSDEEAYVGTFEGKLLVLDRRGEHQRTLGLSTEAVATICADRRGLRAVINQELLTCFSENAISGRVQLPVSFPEVMALEEDLLLWSDRRAWVIDDRARVRWAAEFARPIRGCEPEVGGFTVLAGLLFGFSPSGERARRSRRKFGSGSSRPSL